MSVAGGGRGIYLRNDAPDQQYHQSNVTVTPRFHEGNDDVLCWQGKLLALPEEVRHKAAGDDDEDRFVCTSQTFSPADQPNDDKISFQMRIVLECDAEWVQVPKVCVCLNRYAER